MFVGVSPKKRTSPDTLEIALPIGTPLYWGLLIGGLLGLMAQVRGSWLWVKPS